MTGKAVVDNDSAYHATVGCGRLRSGMETAAATDYLQRSRYGTQSVNTSQLTPRSCASARCLRCVYISIIPADSQLMLSFRVACRHMCAHLLRGVPLQASWTARRRHSVRRELLSRAAPVHNGQVVIPYSRQVYRAVAFIGATISTR
jgi:hypothetical protein